MKKLLIKLWETPFFRNTSYLVSGTAIAQLIGILLTPVLSRYFSPADFGILGSVVTLAGILSTSGTLKYEMGIVQSDSEEEAQELVILSIFSLTVIVVVFFVFNTIFPDLIGYLNISSSSAPIIYLTAFLSIAVGAGNVLIQWQNKRKAYYILSKKAVLGRLSTVLFQLLWALVLTSGVGLVYGNIFGGIVGLIVLLYPLIPEIRKIKIDLGKLKVTALKYYRFVVYTTPQNLLNAISQSLPILTLGRYFGENEVGAYFFSMRILQLPSALIGVAIRQVFYKEAADVRSNIKTLRKKYSKVTLSLTMLISIPTAIIFFFGEGLFSWAFGQEWAVAGEYASWMFLWLSLGFINPPSSVLYFILNRQKDQLIYEAILFVFRLGAIYLGVFLNDALTMIKIYSIVGVVFNVIYIGYISVILYSDNTYAEFNDKKLS